MSNISITNNDLGSVELEGGKFQDELLTLGAADTLAAGTILARSTATGKYMVIYAIGGTTDGNGTPVMVLTQPVTSVGAGQYPIRPLILGDVNKGRLIVDADGDNSNMTEVLYAGLRALGINAVDVQELNIVDTQD